MHVVARLSHLLVLVCLLVTPVIAVAAPQPSGHMRSVEQALVGAPVMRGEYAFWLRETPAPDQLTIVGYNLTQQSPFVVRGKAADARALATDGELVAWIERGPAHRERIQGYDLRSGRELTIVEAADANGFGGIALDRGVLVYQDAAAGRRGIFARTVATGSERLVSATGQGPVAQDGLIVWREEVRHDRYLPVESSLHLLRPDGS